MIMQRSVGTVLPTSRSTPPANANMRAKASTFASLPSPSVSSPTAPAVARPWERPKLVPAPVHVRLFLHAHNLHLARTHVPPLSRSTPVIGPVPSLAGETSTIMAPMLIVICGFGVVGRHRE